MLGNKKMVYCKYTFINTTECEFGCCTHGCCTQNHAEQNEAEYKQIMWIFGAMVGGFIALVIIYYLICRCCKAVKNRRRRAGHVPGLCIITIDLEQHTANEFSRPARHATAQTSLPGTTGPAYDDLFDVHRRGNRLMQPLGLLRRQNGPSIHEIPNYTNAGRDSHEQPGDGKVNTSNGRLDPPATPEVNRPSTVNDIDVANVNFAFMTDEETSKPHQGGERPWPYVGSGNTGSEMQCPGLAGLWGSEA
ncbi:uncharacterized protein LOC128229198 [Mya arenaria]|uniref:uncharacterized protein LOC128229198 n=1 Tax=Mya arenaria TaxID=6604 RepID=UPI0022E08830|nr:uncharacterized protein LOC128229198 [Mya arenaria]